MRGAALTLFLTVLAAGCDAGPFGSNSVDGGVPDAFTGAFAITHVTWFHHRPCREGANDVVTISVDVAGADPTTVSLTGGAVGCVGVLQSNPGEIICRERGGHLATITATDALGHSDTKSFEIVQCQPGTL